MGSGGIYPQHHKPLKGADKPAGPFKAEPQPIEGSFSIDPCSFQDEDGSYYLSFGGMWGGQLQCWEKGYFDGKAPLQPGPDQDASRKLRRLSNLHHQPFA